MSGRFHPIITFPIYIDEARTGRFTIEPFFSMYGYGIKVKVIAQFVGGTGNKRYLYERTLDEEAILRSQIKENELYDMFSEFIEGLYHNKVNQDVAVPVAALLLKTHFGKLIDFYDLDISEYITEVELEEDRKLGFDSHK